MEAFSLLKYWKANSNAVSVGGGGAAVNGDNARTNAVTTTTIVSAVTQQHEDETDDVDSNGDDDDGPFFDLEFSAVNTNDDDVEEDGSDGDCDGDESEFKFTLSDVDGDGDGRYDQNLPLSPSDDLFFNGTLVPIESSSSSLAIDSAELVQNSKHLQFPVSLLKSATKLRVFMLGLKKSKSVAAIGRIESNRSGSASPKQPSELKSQPSELKSQQSELNSEQTVLKSQPSVPKSQQSVPKSQQMQQQESRFFTVKFKVDEVPIVSLFTRDASRSASNHPNKQNSEESDQEKLKFSKEVVQKYLNKVKPLYIRVSKRYGEKLKFSGPLNLISAVKLEPANKSSEIATEAEPNAKGNIPAGLRVVKKHLGKSRSASSAVAAAPAPAPTKRRDDSLLQQQDGIQSAIMHCKRSFNASRDSEKPIISRCASDSTSEKSNDSAKKGTEKVKEK